MSELQIHMLSWSMLALTVHHRTQHVIAMISQAPLVSR